MWTVQLLPTLSCHSFIENVCIQTNFVQFFWAFPLEVTLLADWNPLNFGRYSELQQCESTLSEFSSGNKLGYVRMYTYMLCCLDI